MENINGFKHKNLSSKVAEHLKKEIFLKKYESGERILESEVSRELNISRAPVREAIKELQNQGLVKTIPRKGSFVVDFTEGDIKEIYEIRIVLESRIFKKLIEENILVESDYENLTKIVDDMIDIAKSKEKFNYKIINMNKKDIAFHSYLWDKSGKRWTLNILKTLHSQLKFAMIVDLNLEEDLIKSAGKHYEIIETLRTRNYEKSIKYLSEHIVNYNKELMGKLV